MAPRKKFETIKAEELQVGDTLIVSEQAFTVSAIEPTFGRRGKLSSITVSLPFGSSGSELLQHYDVGEELTIEQR